MTNNPIELRKQAVRRYSRNTVAYVGGGLGGGLLLTVLLTNWTWIILGLIVAVVGGSINAARARRILNQNDNY